VLAPPAQDAGVDDDYVEAVLVLVERVPAGHAVSYGQLADEVRAQLGRGGPRTVARVLALHGGGVPWWRVVTADGRVPVRHAAEARARLLAEGCPLTADWQRVDLVRAGW
jgi:alkylated DNA nucleotide flippase Atl1